jgi:cell division protein FtsQ
VTSSTRARARPRPPIDPRIKQRRIEVTRREGRRRLRIITALVAMIMAIVIAVLLVRSPVLDVDHIVIVGAQHATVDEVVRAAALDRHRLMIDVHSDVIAHRLGAVPWVARATVERRWPATVRITLRERVPVASVPAKGGGWAIVDVGGRVLAHQAAPLADRVQITGGIPAGGVGSVVARPVVDALKVAAAVPPELRPKVSVIGVATDGIELHLVPIGVAKIGSTDQLDAKLDAVLTMLQRANLADLAVLDVRVPGAPVLTRR